MLRIPVRCLNSRNLVLVGVVTTPFPSPSPSPNFLPTCANRNVTYSSETWLSTHRVFPILYPRATRRKARCQCHVLAAKERSAARGIAIGARPRSADKHPARIAACALLRIYQSWPGMDALTGRTHKATAEPRNADETEMDAFIWAWTLVDHCPRILICDTSCQMYMSAGASPEGTIRKTAQDAI